MFHVELVTIEEWAAAAGFKDNEIVSKLKQYAAMVSEASGMFNLTGFKTIEQIESELVVKSLVPFVGENVPRGTKFADLGTGAGVPGIPFAICFPGVEGVLFDSNGKKIDFINRTLGELKVDNVSASKVRIEEAGREKMLRGEYDLVLSRAFAEVYVVLEMAAPFLKVTGRLFVYSKLTFDELPSGVIKHAVRLGLEPASENADNLSRYGLVFEKVKKTAGLYPRRYPIIKRDSEAF